MLSSVMQELIDKQDKSHFNSTDIDLGSLQIDNVIKEILWISDGERTRGLTDIRLERTLGCPFFLNEFRTMLEEEELLLTFNLGLLKWVWDEDVIEEETMSTAIFADLLQARMKGLHDDAQLLLQYAVCLGSPFKLLRLNIIWAKHAISDPGNWLLETFYRGVALYAMARRTKKLKEPAKEI